MPVISVIVTSIVGLKLIDLSTTYFFRRLTKDDYVTKKECEEHRGKHQDYVSKKDCELCLRQDENIISKVTGEISTIKGILLVLAVKSGIPPEELKKLTL